MTPEKVDQKQVKQTKVLLSHGWEGSNNNNCCLGRRREVQLGCVEKKEKASGEIACKKGKKRREERGVIWSPVPLWSYMQQATNGI